jgi:tRNA pseudouridine55 synthase
VYALEVAPGPEPGVFSIAVMCSSGTYVRVLAADIGIALGGGAHLRRLRRTAIGEFTIADAHPVDTLTVDEVLPPAEAMRGYPRVAVDATLVADVRHGKVLAASALGADGAGPWAVVDADGTLLAVYERYDETRVKPAVVIASD